MWNRVQKSLGKKGVRKLNESTVAIVGFGSLGSQTTLFLAMSGVGGFILIDPDILEDHNVVRHAADLRYVGRSKVEVGKELILYRNPNAEVEIVKADALTKKEVMHNVDLVIVAGLGSEIAQTQIGMMLRDLKRPALYGGLYERAVAGEVLFVDPKKGPCYSCFSSVLRETQAQMEEVKQANYGLAPDELKAQPGLGSHVARVAAVVADWTIRLLIDDSGTMAPMPGNLVILANESYVIGTDQNGKDLSLPPSGAWWTTVPKQKSCLICGLEDVEINLSMDQLLEN